MKFHIQRTGQFSDSTEPPHPKAVREDALRVDVRTLKTPEEYDRKLGRPGHMWHDKGANHRVTSEGFIARDFPERVWTIEIGSLEDLLSFSRECRCELVVSSYNEDRIKGLPYLEIYDGYRE